MNTIMKKKGDVSCLALTLYYEFLKNRGIDRRLLQKGLKYSEQHLDNRLNWIDYETFSKIEKRVEELLPNENGIHFSIGASFVRSKAFGYVRILIRSFLTPISVYYKLPDAVKENLFPFVTIYINTINENTVRAEYVFDDGYEISEAFIETVKGMLSAIPEMLGGPPAKVGYKKINENTVVYSVSIESAKNGVLNHIRRLMNRLRVTYALWKKTLYESASELRDANRLLMEKVNDLEETKSELAKKIRSLTLINNLYNATTKSLDMGKMLDAAVTVISKELEDVPCAVLLYDEKNGKWNIQASKNMDEKQKAYLEAEKKLSKICLKRVYRESYERVRFQGIEYALEPIWGREKLLGILALHVNENKVDTTFMETITNQLVSTMENAISHQIVADMTDQLEKRVHERTAELELTKSKLEHTIIHLESANSAKAEFLTNISHEFKTPLTLIFTPLEQLENHIKLLGDKRMQNNIHMIRRNTRILLKYVNELLDFTKIDTNKMPIVPEMIDMCEVIEDVMSLLEPLASRKDITFVLLRDKKRVNVCADPELMSRVFSNLLVNAIKYTKAADSIEVRLVTESSRILIYVIDHGPGIPTDQLEKVFNRFQRVIAGDGCLVEGSGIGLAIAKELVEMHRGSIKVDSKVGKGTTFQVSLPINTEIEKREPDQKVYRRSRVVNDMTAYVENPTIWRDYEKEKAASDNSMEIDKSKLLLVEDNVEMRCYLTELLESKYRVIVAVDGMDGLQRAMEEFPDVIVTDVMMPRMDGFEMCRELKKRTETGNIPIIMLTACYSIEEIVKGFACGVEDFVLKPFSTKELMARINVHLKIRQLTLQLINQEKQAAVGTLSMGVAHEVLNPVNAILNAIRPIREIVLENATPFEGTNVAIIEELINVILVSGKRIHEIVNAILSFARNEDGMPVIKTENVEKAIENILKIVNYRIVPGINIETELDCPRPIMCYPEMLSQAIMNLVTNAIDAVSENGGNIWIKAKLEEERLKVVVKDDGPGISPSNIERIFNPFYTSKPPGKGTGLGLAIAKEIAKHHNGDLRCFSDVGKGTEFTFTVPI